MSTKDKHVLGFWFAKLSELECEKGRAVSAGELSRYVGQSIVTARKYMLRLWSEGAVTMNEVTFKNRVNGTTYQVKG